jgi:hypothetical protein
MIPSEIQGLKDNLNKLVQIETIDAELIMAKVITVFDDKDKGEHELFFELISSNAADFYARFKNSGGFAIDFENILSVSPHAEELTAKAENARP